MGTVTLYKIRHKVTGLYRMAGAGIPGRWGKTGKAWPSIGLVKLHLNLLRYDTKHPLPAECKNWEVVVLKVEESEALKMEIEELWQSEKREDGPLPIGSRACPRDGAALHFELFGTMRVARLIAGNRLYHARCPECRSEYHICAGEEA